MSRGNQEWLISEIAATAAVKSERVARQLIERCESPIEQEMALAIILEAKQAGWSTSVVTKPGPGIGTVSHLGVRVWPQYPVGSFRGDLRVEMSYGGTSSSVIVECDGHDFHERTKEQAQRDKSRDRAIAAAGHHVIRFTGTEIRRDPMACAMDVMDVLWAKLQQLRGEAEKGAAE